MIHVSRLTKFFGPRPAIEGLSFEIKKGEVVGFLGPNGAGKSTTMKIITGFTSATSGKVTVNGYDVFENSLNVKKSIGFLPETPPVYLDMTVEDYIKFAAAIHQVPKKNLSSFVHTALEKTSLMDVRKRIIGNLSKGYRQRVGIAQALVHNPPVLILDEPTVGLDPKQIIEIRTLIKGLANNHTVILSSHILPEVTATCQRVLIINQGKIVAEDTIDHLAERTTRGQTFALKVKHTTPEAIEKIKRIEGVLKVDQKDDSSLHIEMHPNHLNHRDKIIETAVNSGMGVLEFSLQKVSLEEIFLQLISTQKGA